jgi:hypothetical protein
MSTRFGRDAQVDGLLASVPLHARSPSYEAAKPAPRTKNMRQRVAGWGLRYSDLADVSLLNVVARSPRVAMRTYTDDRRAKLHFLQH